MRRHQIVTFWDGEHPLHYIHHISLTSFLAHGHDVKLFSFADQSQINAPSGVTVIPVFEAFPQFEDKFDNHAAPQIADLLRPHLIAKYDAVWVDTDVVCVQALSASQRYLFSTEAAYKIAHPREGNLNNAVLYLPPDSPSLKVLCDFSNTVLGVEQSDDPRVIHYLTKVRTHPFLRYGPPALTRFLFECGELDHQRAPKELSPIHFNVSDCYWDPLVDVEARFDEDTLTTHLWDSQVRPGWYRRAPLEGSYMDKLAKRFDVDVKPYIRRKKMLKPPNQQEANAPKFPIRAPILDHKG